jgi:hypothetical protein
VAELVVPVFKVQLKPAATVAQESSLLATQAQYKKPTAEL